MRVRFSMVMMVLVVSSGWWVFDRFSLVLMLMCLKWLWNYS